MLQVMSDVTGVISHHAVEVFLGFSTLLLLAALILLLILIRRKPDDIIATMHNEFVALAGNQERLENVVKDEITLNRQETANDSRLARLELANSLKLASDSIQQRLLENIHLQKGQLDSFSRQLVALVQLNEEKIEAMRQTMATQLRSLQEDNTSKLEQMRATVDEKLQTTLDKRLGQSFQQVNDRLEQVYKGLGEMRHLARGVGDLKKVLTNVKTRGTWGEIRLNNLLEQILTSDQYACNVATKKSSNDRVEFAIRLPGQGAAKDGVVWLPIDAKFPQEDYQRLMDAQESADKDLAHKSIRNLDARIRAEAKFIKDKYLDPPHTTDFAIMFLPVEGLYAEVLRRPGLFDTLQREHRIVVAGPTTLAALLNSLQMGFRTLAIEKRSSEVWELLSLVKSDFGQFGDVLVKTKKKLQEASNTINQAEVRTRAIERKLGRVQELPGSESAEVIQKN